MAVTYKLFLDQRRKRNTNEYPLKVRVTLNRKHKEIPLNVVLNANHWDEEKQRVKPSHPNVNLINKKITKTLSEIQANALKLDDTDKVYSVNELSPTNGSKEQTNTTFLSYANKLIDDLRSVGRVGNAISYGCAVAKLKKYCNNDGIRFESIDYNFLENFTNSMLQGGMKINAVGVYMREIRAIYNKAIKAGIVEQKYYPFSNYKIKTSKTINRRLAVDDLKKIFEYKTEPNTIWWHSQNYFLLSFCLIGINLTDLFLLKPENLIGDRVVFKRSKTKKIYSIHLHEKARVILNLYYHAENKPYYLLPVLSEEDTPLTIKKKAQQAIKNTNKYIGKIAEGCKLNEDITSYFARYSWANTCKSLGYSKDLIAEALGHEYGNKVTGIYLDHYDNAVIDEANEKVIAAVFS